MRKQLNPIELRDARGVSGPERLAALEAGKEEPSRAASLANGMFRIIGNRKARMGPEREPLPVLEHLRKTMGE